MFNLPNSTMKTHMVKIVREMPSEQQQQKNVCSLARLLLESDAKFLKNKMVGEPQETNPPFLKTQFRIGDRSYNSTHFFVLFSVT